MSKNIDWSVPKIEPEGKQGMPVRDIPRNVAPTPQPTPPAPTPKENTGDKK